MKSSAKKILLTINFFVYFFVPHSRGSMRDLVTHNEDYPMKLHDAFIRATSYTKLCKTAHASSVREQLIDDLFHIATYFQKCFTDRYVKINMPDVLRYLSIQELKLFSQKLNVYLALSPSQDAHFTTLKNFMLVMQKLVDVHNYFANNKSVFDIQSLSNYDEIFSEQLFLSETTQATIIALLEESPSHNQPSPSPEKPVVLISPLPPHTKNNDNKSSDTSLSKASLSDDNQIFKPSKNVPVKLPLNISSSSDEDELSDEPSSNASSSDEDSSDDDPTYRPPSNTSSSAEDQPVKPPSDVSLSLDGDQIYRPSSNIFSSLECHICGKKFISNKKNLDRHIREVHEKQKREEQIACQKCGFYLATQSSLKRHLAANACKKKSLKKRKKTRKQKSSGRHQKRVE